MPKYFKLIAENRKARFDFEILDTYKAGLVLTGTEIKSIRSGRVNLKESFGRVDKQEIWIYGLHISPYASADTSKIDPVRPRKVLLKKSETRKLISQAAEKGLTIVPLKIFLEGNWAKVDLGLAKAKRKYEKRATIRRKEAEKEIEKAFKGKVHGS
ncbi:SsrA-binding protein [candidate division WOR-1 bacterium RIFOXYB2_FULL_42_35]|uniref:SsrA-binding protein n=1 Tax=candidate division WOR-1 bacterium RIFOXYC2_FULL_41_25 TaxID=1802586 RepID=A0A1F4TLY4_UNCSA|nr:MAG: SsrA-binding protein [candidate division WOR-1 bacterium RIFOXYA2_FULL_41_14]OGC23605.1 MAG: SsrA-binding protein [candidate division WOR-1 bacterium RIFOXYB2_FULL_42_35]OGC33569.1 MAG: SsrA-binding protein [candidate division WOR-1 bacterium RIFOXYC2_FULL_41_25]OGC41886.1 MAG: SsrA-binding protein [candidate division WOR-1 bacterium RIFOXYD2_FULL_41_8]